MVQTRHQYLIIDWANDAVRCPVVSRWTRTSSAGDVIESKGKNAVRNKRQVIYGGAICP